VSLQTPIPSLALHSIVHPSDFSPASEVAFAHALKLALVSRAALRLIHVARELEGIHWSDFPGVRTTLAQWGLLPADSPREAVGELGLDVQKILTPGADPINAMLHYLTEHRVELVVLTTHQRTGLPRWMHRAVAEPLARQAATMTLFVPQGRAGFVTLGDGAVTLRHILIPIDHVPPPHAAVETAAAWAHALAGGPVTFTLVHVGAAEAMPAVSPPQDASWTWERTVRQGQVVEQILTLATACAADLIVLTTQGHHGLLDALRGSTTERILRGAPCPVLAIPTRSSP